MEQPERGTRAASHFRPQRALSSDRGATVHGGRGMRILVVALAAIALLIVPAHAQGRGKGRNSGSQQQQSAEQKQKAAEAEKAYKAALDKIPDQKFDPWAKMR
jgi:hypothetical protein